MAPTAIAVIGLACRFPAAAGPSEFWRLVSTGQEVCRPLDAVADFDAAFFNISPREAAAMDPRQRLALELSWELFEDAFLVPEHLRGDPIAVYLGAMNDDYALLTLRADAVDHHTFAGISRGMIANRLSYFYGWCGPSLTVDCGQSSSLVAVHLACENLRAGAVPMAVAGGVHLNTAGEIARLETEFGAISPSGHTYAFDERADGYVRGEGGALVLLKPLPAALADGNRIHAIIAGSAVGNAGRDTSGLTVPSAAAQAEVMRRALAGAGLRPDHLDYVEAHGTGTAVGDPVEARALGEVFGARRNHPLPIGSVKTNIGHTGAAAGVAGLVKTILAVEKACLPASLNFKSAGTDLHRLGLQVNTALTPWPQGECRRAGVSSFGMGGTNAHVIVEQAPTVPDPAAQRGGRVTVPWVLSARSAQSLAGQAARLGGLADAADIVDVGWSLVATRSVFEHRAVLVGDDRAQLAAGLAGLVAGGPGGGAVTGHARSLGGVVFVFPGQGAQYPGMGRELYQRFPAFAAAFDRAVDALEPHLSLPLRQVLWGDDAHLTDGTEFAQPGLFAVQLALTALLRSWGITADAVLGHSVGELAAACEAGVLSLPDAARVVAARGRLMAGLPTGGVMVAVAAGEGEVLPLLGAQVSLAAVNAPDSVVLSGSEAAVGAAVERLTGAGRRVRRLAVSHAFHSALMEPMIEDFAQVLTGLSAHPPRIQLVSNVTGQLADTGYGSASYWVEHVRKPVRFADGMQTAVALGAEVFIEVGPGAGLAADHDVSAATLIRGHSEVLTLLTGVGRLFAAGLPVDWVRVFDGLGARPVDLPTYAFARQRHWLGGNVALDVAAPVAAQLSTEDPAEQRRLLVDVVCLHAAVVLGLHDRHAIDPQRAFQDLGFTSMSGVELRNRLKTEASLAGLPLSRTLIFDYPSPVALADHLLHELGNQEKQSDDEKIWSLLRNIPISELRRTGLLDKLLLLSGNPQITSSDLIAAEKDIDSLSPDALIEMTRSISDAGH